MHFSISFYHRQVFLLTSFMPLSLDNERLLLKVLSRDFQWSCATDQTAPKQFSIPLNKLRWTIWCSSTFFIYYAYVFVTFLAWVTVIIFSLTAHCNLKVVTGYFHEIDHRPSVMAILVMEFSREGYKIRKVFG